MDRDARCEARDNRHRLEQGTDMRTLTALTLMLTATSAAASTGQERAAAAGAPLIGAPAPQIVLTTIDGARIDLGALYGRKAIYLKFWATWCVPCREQMPHFEHAFETAGPDLVVIAVNAGFNDTVDDVRDYRRALGLRMPIVIDDGRLAGAFNLRVTPQHVVIGRDGRIAYIGHLADARLDAALEAARRAKPASATAAPAQAVAALASGDHLPAWPVVTLDGERLALSGAGKGAPLVLVFLSPWCESYLAASRPARAAACRDARVAIDALAASAAGVQFLGIASGLWASRDDLAEYRSDHRVAVPLALDDSGALFRGFGVREVPVLILADRDGRIVDRFSDANALHAALDRLGSR